MAVRLQAMASTRRGGCGRAVSCRSRGARTARNEGGGAESPAKACGWLGGFRQWLRCDVVVAGEPGAPAPGALRSLPRGPERERRRGSLRAAVGALHLRAQHLVRRAAERSTKRGVDLEHLPL